MSSATGRKALGEALDSQVAELATKPKGNKTKPKQGNTTNKKKGRMMKRVARSRRISQRFLSISFSLSVNAFSKSNSCILLPGAIYQHAQPRLRDKGQKARELAIDMGTLGIPHQEAYSSHDMMMCQNTKYPKLVWLLLQGHGRVPENAPQVLSGFG